jgi:hypothetical protein
MELTLWIKTKNEKGENGFLVQSIEHAAERFIQYQNKMNILYDEVYKEKRREFSAKITDENDKVIMPWVEFKHKLGGI